jgi:hypothetical protein
MRTYHDARSSERQMKYEFNLSVSIHPYTGKGKWGGLYIKRENDDKLLIILRYMLWLYQ